MKKKTSYFVISLAAIIIIHSSRSSASDLPSWNPTALDLKLNASLFKPDDASLNEIKNGKVEYSSFGELYVNPAGVLRFDVPAAELDKTTPIKTLTELILAFQSGDVSRIVGLFSAASRDEMRGIYSDPTSGAELVETVKSTTAAEVLAIVQIADKFTAIVRLTDRSGVSMEPFGLMNQDGKYYLTPIIVEGTLVTNLLLFLDRNPVSAIEQTVP